MDRLLTNSEKNHLTSVDRSIYNTKKKKITNYIKKTWPLDSPAPRFRNNPEGMKAFQEVVDTLSKDEDYTFPKAGLGSNAIAQIIRKHMDERRRRETDMKQSLSSHSESDASSTSGENSPESGEKCKTKQLDDYYNKELTLSSAEAVLLVWLGKATMHEVKLDKDLKPLARQFNLKLLRNKDKNMHVRAISSTLIEKGLVSVTTNLNNVSREDVTVKG